MQKDIYNFKSKNKLFLLEQLENFDNKERVDIENLISSKELNIEHIMPQKLTSYWRDELGENYEIIYEQYLHTLGNITLTGYNSKMSNKPFKEKRDMDKGFKYSRLYLNKELSKQDNWNEEAINKRANQLKQRALEIWTYPNSSYQTKEDNLKIFTLSDDDKNFTGEKILSFRFMDDKEYQINSWKDFYKKVSRILHDLDPISFKEIIIQNNYDFQSARKADTFMVNDIPLYTNLNIESFLSKIRVILEEMGLSLDDLSFTIE